MDIWHNDSQRSDKFEMNTEQIHNELEQRDNHGRALLLLNYGHELTVMARDAYEFQSLGVTNPRLLRNSNEILHRVFQALYEIETQSDNDFSLSGIGNWISCEDRPDDIEQASQRAFSRALEKCNV